MGRPPCCGEGVQITKGHWLPEEDNKLLSFMEKNGHVNWKGLPKLAGLNRCSKSCRLRWTNYLRPNIKRGPFSEVEEQEIIKLHSCLGNKWSAIASRLPGRTDNEIKNYWNTHLSKKLLRLGIDPRTHQPRRDLALLASIPALLVSTNMTSFSPTNPFYLHSSAQELAKINLLQTLIQILSPNSSQNVSSMPNTTTNCNLFGPNNHSNSIPLMFHHDRKSNEIAIPTTIGPESLPYIDEPSISFDPNYNQSPMVSSASSSENYNVANANPIEDLQSNWFIGPPSSSSGFEFGDINW